MHIGKIFSKLLACIVGVFLSCGISLAATNLPTGEISEYGNWLNQTNLEMFHSGISEDFQKFEPKMNLDAKTFVPIEAKLGLVFMKALSGLDTFLQMSLVQFVIVFLLVVYAAWVGHEAFKMINDSTDYNTVFSLSQVK